MDRLVLSSIGACVAQAGTKQESVVVAYGYEVGKVSFILMPPPKKSNYVLKDFLDAIGKAEKVKTVVYRDDTNNERNVYMCREPSGKVKDVVDRDLKTDRFIKGFCEVSSLKLNFSLSEKNVKMKQGVCYELKFNNSAAAYDNSSLEYAIINAYNACLLGFVFKKDGISLETKYGEPIRHEIRCKKGSLDDSVMDITPIINPIYEYVDAYETETFKYIDEDALIECKYKIEYNSRGGGYIIKRV